MLDQDARLEVLWRHVLGHWEDEAAHHAFLQNCQAEKRLADAATRYRGMAGDHTRRDVAEKKLQAIVVMALAEMQTEHSAPAPASGNRRLWLLAASALLALLLLTGYLALV